MKRLLLFLLAAPLLAQNFTPQPVSSYIFSGGVWAPLTGTGTGINFTPPPAALYVWNGTAWTPWTGASGGGPPTGAAGGDLGGTYPNPTVVASHITSGSAGFTGPVTITNTATSGNTLFLNTSSLFGSAVAPMVLQGNAASGPAFGFTNSTYGTNNKTWDIYENPTSLDFRTSDDANSSNVTWLSAVRSGNAITGITSNSGSGTWAHAGIFSVTSSAATPFMKIVPTAASGDTQPLTMLNANMAGGTKECFDMGHTTSAGSRATFCYNFQGDGFGSDSVQIGYEPATPTLELLVNTRNARFYGDVTATSFTLSSTSAATITANTGGGITSATCATAVCNNLRGTVTVVGGTATTGTIFTLAWTATPAAYVCQVSQNDTGVATAYLGLGHTVATTTGMTVSAGISVIGTTFNVDYNCQQ